MTRKTFCDECGKEVAGDRKSEIHLRWSDYDEEGRLLDDGQYYQDLCDKCYVKALKERKWRE